LNETSSDEPLHRRILAAVERPILSGEWKPGAKIASEQELARKFSCARMTVNKALSELARKGLIERRRRGGSFVARPQGQAAVLEIRDIRTEVEALGLTYAYELLSREKGWARAGERKSLGLGSADPVLRLAARHLAGEKPFCLEERAISLRTVPEAEAQSFADEAPGFWLLGKVPWSEAEHRISAAGADRPAADALELEPGAPCLVVERRTWWGGRGVTAARLTYPAAAHALVARFSPRSG
jgi:GntR family histidine utilization transcriptional repressor